MMAADRQIDQVDRYVEEHLDEFLDDLGRLVALPSVAAKGEGMDAAAEATRDLLAKYGVDARTMPSDIFPMVYGELRGASPKTVLCYNHYDVQPAEPFDLWDSPPFEATRRDGSLYGRGVGDDKGHIVCRLAAIAALRAVHGELPCSVKFLVEGEEEVGSGSMPAFIDRHADLLRADGCLWEFGGVDYEGRPQIYLGMRGDVYVELRSRTISHDAHSGLGGSILPNAAWRLVWALNTLKGPDERIRIPGWYDDVRPPSARDLEMLASLPSEEEALKGSFGVDGFLKGATGVELRRQQVFEPTCTVAGIGGGYQGPGSKTVLPAGAMAKVDFRIVPAQEPDDLMAKLRHHLDAQGFGDIEVIQHGGSRAARVSPDDPFVQLVADAGTAVFGRPTVIYPMSGGSGPMDPFVRFLGVPIANVGIGYPDGLAHAPNEHVRIDDFVKGVKQTARVLAGMADLP
ncbi:MAG TPA: M20/M25/M40 family metallo-hydrolase [Thermomicrobiaceae bacterium]|nr:M20/M25/M40 family metallo-hydrolase [Thermomicrobiaceae bacterium]